MKAIRHHAGKRSLLWLGLALPLGCTVSCQPAFETEIPARSLKVVLTSSNLGTPDARLPLTFEAPQTFTVHVEADDETGNVDPTFTGFVRFSIQPGTVVSVAGANTNGRNVELINGVADSVTVSVVGAYGDARIWAEDLGYVPADPAGVPLPGGGSRPPQCSNGIDDNQNGLIDYPSDPGCYAANDDTENGGSYAGAASGTLYFVYPRIADVQGVDNGGAGTPFPNEQVQIDTEWNGTTGNTPKGVVVVGISATGFYVTDVGETRGYASVYGYTYSTPALMNVCDRLITFGGTSANFFGFTEINYPTWSLEEWDPDVRPCLVPPPAYLTSALLMGGTSGLIPLEAGLVRVPALDGTKVRVTDLLGPGLIKYTTAADGTVTITQPIQADATSCDFNGTGSIDFSDPAESACENACSANLSATGLDCSEYSQFLKSNEFNLVVTAPGQPSVTISADGSASTGFNPADVLGQQLTAFTGTLGYFSGGSQFTIQARCSDDLVAPSLTPLTGPVSVVANSTSVTFSAPTTLNRGDVLRFSSQPSVFYAMAAAVSGGTTGTLSAAYTGATSPKATAGSLSALPFTLDVVAGSMDVATSTPAGTNLVAGTTIQFSSQLGAFYEVKSVSDTGLVLGRPYDGPSAAAAFATNVGTVLPTSPAWPTPDGGTQAPAACVVDRSSADQTIEN